MDLRIDIQTRVLTVGMKMKEGLWDIYDSALIGLFLCLK